MKIRRYQGLVAAAALIAVTTASASATSAPPNAAAATCMPADEFTSRITAYLQRAVTSSDTAIVAARNHLQLPVVAPSAVTYVTDNAVCSSAEQAYTAAVVRTPSATPSGAVYVWKVGTVYVVIDQAQTVGEWRIAMTLDRRFKVLVQSTI